MLTGSGVVRKHKLLRDNVLLKQTRKYHRLKRAIYTSFEEFPFATGGFGLIWRDELSPLFPGKTRREMCAESQ